MELDQRSTLPEPPMTDGLTMDEDEDDELDEMDDLDEEEDDELDASDSDDPLRAAARPLFGADDGFVDIDERADDDDEGVFEPFAEPQALQGGLIVDSGEDGDVGVMPRLPMSLVGAAGLQSVDLLEVQVTEGDRVFGSVFCSRDSKLASVRRRVYADQLFPRTVHFIFLTPAGVPLTGRQERTHRVAMLAVPLGTGSPPAARLGIRTEVTARSTGTRSVGTQTPSRFPRAAPSATAAAAAAASAASATATTDRPFVCNVRNCLKAYRTLRALEEHMRIHTGERPYVCGAKDCSRSFRTATELARHKRVHTGEKPYMCQAHNCGKVFRRRHHMIEHSRMHLPDRPFECDGCKRTFKHADSLKRHLKTHAQSDAPPPPAPLLVSMTPEQMRRAQPPPSQPPPSSQQPQSRPQQQQAHEQQQEQQANVSPLYDSTRQQAVQ